MYAGDAEALSLMTRYDIEYAVVGPSERSLLKVNDAFFSQFEVTTSLGPYRLYRVNPGRTSHAERH
jgi:uncharacterized membrane protein